MVAAQPGANSTNGDAMLPVVNAISQEPDTVDGNYPFTREVLQFEIELIRLS